MSTISQYCKAWEASENSSLADTTSMSGFSIDGILRKDLSAMPDGEMLPLSADLENLTFGPPGDKSAAGAARRGSSPPEVDPAVALAQQHHQLYHSDSVRSTPGTMVRQLHSPPGPSLLNAWPEDGPGSPVAESDRRAISPAQMEALEQSAAFAASSAFAQAQARKAYLQEYQRTADPALASAAAAHVATAFFSAATPAAGILQSEPVLAAQSSFKPAGLGFLSVPVSTTVSAAPSPHPLTPQFTPRLHQQSQLAFAAANHGAPLSSSPPQQAQHAHAHHGHGERRRGHRGRGGGGGGGGSVNSHSDFNHRSPFSSSNASPYTSGTSTPFGSALPSPVFSQSSPTSSATAGNGGMSEFRAAADEGKLAALVNNFDVRDPAHVALVPQLAMDQQGSRYIQQLLENITPEEFTLIFNALLPSLVVASQNVFGNYVAQKVLACSSAAQQRAFVEHLRGSLVVLSCHPCGCRVIQRVLDTVDLPLHLIMADEFATSIRELAVNHFGNHVLQRAIDKLPAVHVDVLARAFGGAGAAFSGAGSGLIISVAANKFGCRILQRLMERSTPEVGSQLRDRVVKCLCSHVQEMCFDQYANYVSQHALAHGSAAQRSLIIQACAGSLVAMGTHKFASNVLEKCFLFGSVEDRAVLASEMMNLPQVFAPNQLQRLCLHYHSVVPGEPFRQEGHGGLVSLQLQVGSGVTNVGFYVPPNLATMARNSFGNYVVQTMLSVLERKDRDFITSVLELSPYGSQVVCRFRENYGAAAAP